MTRSKITTNDLCNTLKDKINNGIVNIATATTLGVIKQGNNISIDAEGTISSNSGSGLLSVAEGNGTTASGDYSHAEGSGATASGMSSHAEGNNTIAGVSDYYLTTSLSGFPINLNTESGFPEIILTVSPIDIKNFFCNDSIKLIASGDASECSSINNTWLVSDINKTTNTITIDSYDCVSFVNSRNITSISSFKKIGSYFSHAEGSGTVASGTNSHAEGQSTTASGISSHAEGIGTTASGINSHAEGNGTTASGIYSHAEGASAVTSGNYSHAEGSNTVASGDSSHAEGNYTTASGSTSHAEGSGTVASGINSHAEGKFTLASNGTLYKITAFDDTAKTITLDNVTGLVVGNKLDIKITSSKSLINIPITVINGLVVTLNTTSTLNSLWKYAIDRSTNMYPTHAEGNNTIASGNYSHAEGDSTTASGDNSHAEGQSTTASGGYSHAEGNNTIASGNYSHAEGLYNQSRYAQHAMGQYGTISDTTDTAYLATGEAFMIANGTGTSARGLAFKVMFDGKTYADGAYASAGADYAEYFEWLDGNADNEDRVGFFVAMDGDKIRKANSTDDYILGVISATPSVVGDNYESWQCKYIIDEFGRIQYHDVTIPESYRTLYHEAIYDMVITQEVLDDYGNVIIPYSEESVLVKEAYEEQVVEQEERVEVHPIYNQEWDSSKEYIAREHRQEWSPVGMMGKLLVRDDGTCKINQYCKPNDEGIAILCDKTSEVKYRVIKRINKEIIQVIIK